MRIPDLNLFMFTLLVHIDTRVFLRASDPKFLQVGLMIFMNIANKEKLYSIKFNFALTLRKCLNFSFLLD